MSVGAPEVSVLVGSSLPRRQDARLLRGRGRFVDDIELPGMLHAAFVRSPHAHALIAGIDVTAARSAPGVRAVFTGADLRAATGRPLEIVTSLRRAEVRLSRQPVLPVDKVRFAGEPVAIVVARTRYLAEDACELVEVLWESLAAVTDAESALIPGRSWCCTRHPETTTLLTSNTSAATSMRPLATRRERLASAFTWGDGAPLRSRRARSSRP